MAEHNSLGAWGEQMAADHLVSQGYAIMARNTKVAGVEVDIIAMKDTDIAFVEVKTRSEGGFDPLSAVTPRKQQRLARAADSFLRAYALQTQARLRPRFDIITVVGAPGRTPDLRHYPDAFLPPLVTPSSRSMSRPTLPGTFAKPKPNSAPKR